MSKIKPVSTVYNSAPKYCNSSTDDEALSASSMRISRTTQRIWIAQVEDSLCYKHATFKRFTNASHANNSSYCYANYFMSNF